jgi:ATP-dependent Clp protease ATP-binding subunit ClpA
MGYELEITPEAREIIVTQALQNSRIGARSLRETLGRIIELRDRLFALDPL